MKDPTKAELEKAGEQLKEIRMMLGVEAELLCQTYPARLVSYALLTTAIRTAAEDGMSVEQFAHLSLDAIELYTGREPKAGPRVIIV
jgi:hypothetical protein